MERARKMCTCMLACAFVASVGVGEDAVVSNPDGLLAAVTGEDLTDALVGGNLVLGTGMLAWTGTGVTDWSGNVVLQSADNRSVTVNVTDPDATLRISGSVTQPGNASFIKYGPGTLELTGTGTPGSSHRLGKKMPWTVGYWKDQGATEGGFTQKDMAYDDRGVVTNGGHTGFTVAQGTLRLNAPGETFTLSELPWVGNRLQYSPRLEITNNTIVKTDGSWLTIGRGTGRSSNNATPCIRLTDGGSLEVSGLCFGNAIGTPDYCSHSRLEIDGGRMSVAAEIFMPENTGDVALSVANGGSFSHTMGILNYSGFKMSYTSTYDLSHSATGSTHLIGFSDKASVSVRDGSLFRLDGTIPTYYNGSGVRTRKVLFDGGALAPYADVIAEWFGGAGVGVTNFQVGAQGLAVTNAGPAYLIPGLRLAEGVTSSSGLVKRGAGSLFLKPVTNMPVTLEQGGLVQTPNRLWTNAWARTLAPASGTHVSVAGEGALGGLTIRPQGDFSLNFRANGKDVGADGWTCLGFAKALPDGTIQLTMANGKTYGNAWRTEKVHVDESFIITFDSFTRYTSLSDVDGWMLIFQTNSVNAVGGNGGNMGFNYGNTVTNRFVTSYRPIGAGAWAIGTKLSTGTDTTGGIMVGQNGNSILYQGIPTMVNSAVAASPEQPCSCRFAYDAAAHEATFSIFVPKTGETFTRTESVDLAARLGATAYVGFGGSTGTTSVNGYSEHCIRNFRFISGLATPAPDCVRAGGTVQLAANGTLGARLESNAAFDTFAVDTLAAAGAATLDVADAGTDPDTLSIPPLTLDDPSLWTLTGKAFWRADGTLATSQAANSSSGGAYSNNSYPVVGGSWTFAMDWMLGNHSGTAADYFRCTIGGVGEAGANAASGLSFALQNYDGSIAGQRCSYFFFYTNNVSVAEGCRKPMAAGFNLQSETPVRIQLAYDDSAKTLAVSLAQGAATDTFEVPCDMKDIFRGRTRARVGFHGQVGGCWSENVVSNLSWTGDAVAAAMRVNSRRPALAFDRITGATTLVKRGSGDLAFLRPDALGTTVTLAEGGLRFAKEPLETVTVGAGGGWIFNESTGVYTATNGVKIGTNVQNNRDTAQLRHRVRVSGKWRASWRMWNTVGADAISFFMHNDPRGNNVVGAQNTGAGYNGIQKGAVVAWYTYTNASSTNKMGVGTTGTSMTTLMNPVEIRGAKPIDTTLVYDGAAKTLDVTLVQNGNTFTHQFTNWDVKTAVGDDYAWLGFGSGGGGVHSYPYFDNVKFEQLDATDTLAEAKYLGRIDVTAANGVITLDSPLAGGAFNVADAVSVPENGTLHVMAANASATLRTGTLTLGAGATLAGDAEATVAPDVLAGDLSALRVDGTVLALPAMEKSTFEKTDVYLTNGAKLRVGATGLLRVHNVYVDGVKQEGGVFRAASVSWLDSASAGGIVTRMGSVVVFR